MTTTMHRHRWIDSATGRALSGRVRNGTIRVCVDCHCQQVKIQGRWERNLVPTGVNYPKEAQQ